MRSVIWFGEIKRHFSGVPGLASPLATLALLVLATASASLPVSPAHAQAGQCTQSCQTAYAQCYKATGSNRKVCEAQLQQCLARCIDKR
jgi:hypothetical protein